MQPFKIITGLVLTIALFAGVETLAVAADKKADAAEPLSCSKQARRIHKITDRAKKRAFIAKCQAEREAREKAKLEAERRKKKAAKTKEDAAMKALLNGNR